MSVYALSALGGMFQNLVYEPGAAPVESLFRVDTQASDFQTPHRSLGAARRLDFSPHR